MAEEYNQSRNEVESGDTEVRDRGLFDFMGKNKEETKKVQEEVPVTQMEKLHMEDAEKKKKEKVEEEKKEEGEKEEKKEGLLQKLHRSHSSSSSSSSDEEEEGGNKEKKKKNKKGLKDKIKDKMGGDKKEREEEKRKVEGHHGDTSVPVEKVDHHEPAKLGAAPEEDKKGFVEKIKEKFPGQKKPVEESGHVAVGGGAYHGKVQEGVEGHNGKEKKGILGKIMDKLPGYHKNGPGEESEKTPPAGH